MANQASAINGAAMPNRAAMARREEAKPQVIDCCVHPSFPRSDDLRRYLPEPWRSYRMPDADRYLYPAPFPEELPEARPAGGGRAGSDPELVAHQLFEERGVDYAILLPLGRGLQPEPAHDAAISRAINEWLAEVWLTEHNAHGRFKGSIRVSPNYPEKAVEEIERWANHPHFVQVAVPMATHAPYGHPQYLPIWEAAAHYGLPVAIHADGGGGVELMPTILGFPSHYAEFYTLYPLNAVFHLGSFIAEGVFERLPSLKIVFADGGIDAFLPILWRFDKDWQATRMEVPWVEKRPTHYLKDHVRFIAHRSDGPDDPALMPDLLELCRAEDLLLFGSNYPHWDILDPRDAFSGVPEPARRRILAENAQAWYRM